MPRAQERRGSEDDIEEEDEEAFRTDSELSEDYHHQRSYAMGPILQAMVSEWNKGDELIKSDKHKQ